MAPLICSIRLTVSLMSWAIVEMPNIVWCFATVVADVEASILTDSALVGAKESTMSGS